MARNIEHCHVTMTEIQKEYAGWMGAHSFLCFAHRVSISLVFLFGAVRGAHGARTVPEAKEKNSCGCKQTTLSLFLCFNLIFLTEA